MCTENILLKAVLWRNRHAYFGSLCPRHVVWTVTCVTVHRAPTVKKRSCSILSRSKGGWKRRHICISQHRVYPLWAQHPDLSRRPRTLVLYICVSQHRVYPLRAQHPDLSRRPRPLVLSTYVSANIECNLSGHSIMTSLGVPAHLYSLHMYQPT